MSRVLISVDPGVKTAGVAAFEGNELMSAWLVKGACWRDTALAVSADVTHRVGKLTAQSTLAIEIPQVYVQSRQKGDPNDLIQLALGAGCMAGIIGALVVSYRPREWKGQVPKDVMIGRIQKKISPQERARVELPSAKSLQHNVWDAIGIGLHHLGRKKDARTKTDQNRRGVCA